MTRKGNLMLKALQPGDRVVIDLEAAQALPPDPCPFCHQAMPEDEWRMVLRSYAEGEWTVGPRNTWTYCPDCSYVERIPKDRISLIATHPIKMGGIESSLWAVPRSIVSLPLPLEA